MGQTVVICATVVAVILFAFGVGKVCFERGYVHGYEDAKHPETVEVTLDDEE